MATVSIIVTTYNIEKYIELCLESVAAQTLSDIEVLVVDDGSSDSTPDKIRSFAEKDPRFIPVLLGENSPGGVATAANAGLDRATSEWIGFVDGDDYVEPHMFESLYRAAADEGADLAMCQYLEVSEDGSQTHRPADARRWGSLPFGQFSLDIDARKRLLRFIAVPWRKLYRRSMLESNSIRFPVGDYFYEDNPFHWFSLLSASSIATVPHVLCYHRVGRPGQTMASADERLFRIFRHHDTIHVWLEERSLLETYQSVLVEWVISQCEWITRRTPKALRRDLYDILRPIIAKYSREVVLSALRDGGKGEYAQRFTAALVAGDAAAFGRAIDTAPKSQNLVTIGLSQLRHSGVRSTAKLSVETLRHRLGPTIVGRGWRRVAQSAGGGTSNAQTLDLMFTITVLERRLQLMEQKLDEVLRLQKAAGKTSSLEASARPSSAAPAVATPTDRAIAS
ncbi:MAG: putative glycosyltransferase [Microbacterium sp.]|jgi:glycosyltransferase involved in cell wall biosynthesis|uniref:glycosyltransferase family 2 protein n=1 Tax=Microbacterium sp. TaxID=51671 RepID=UPI002620840F|nr:glycosyltransferase family 2 protein [Microbacterium sp.]MDF2563311.1 putative glycosyltransferase [Microbacterium sp.]